MYDPSIKPLKLMVMITDRNRAKKTGAYLDKAGCKHQYALLGAGTAPDDISAILGVGETEKAVILALSDAEKYPAVFDGLRTELEFGAGGGIAFVVPVNSVGNVEVIMHMLGVRPAAKRT
ncbi:MAG: hypothetical protein LBH24_00405 [Clostridiales bacterium]|jgi:hypothetical protein|nr:hypothetical protein [Clostridiales bacterium]